MDAMNVVNVGNVMANQHQGLLQVQHGSGSQANPTPMMMTSHRSGESVFHPPGGACHHQLHGGQPAPAPVALVPVHPIHFGSDQSSSPFSL